MSNIAKILKRFILATEDKMKVSGLISGFNTRTSGNKPPNKNNWNKGIDDPAAEVTEKLEPGEKNSSRDKNIKLLRPQFKQSAPVAKTDVSAKSIFETIHYKDVPENELKEKRTRTLFSEGIGKSEESDLPQEIKINYYLTLPAGDLEKAANNRNKFAGKSNAYSPRSKYGVLVNITA